MNHRGKNLTLFAGLISLSVSPVAGQDTGGRTMRFDLSERVEAVRNPTLNPGQDDSEILSTTNLGYELSSQTRSDELSLRLQAALRVPFGSSSDDPDIDDTGATLRYRHIAPGATFTTLASIRRRDLAYLRSFDLDEDDDIDALNNTGDRINSNLQFGVDFGQDRPFGWGASVGASKVRYKNLGAGSTLTDYDRENATLTGRFDLSEVTQLTSSLTYSQSQEEGSNRLRTYGANFALSHLRETSEYRTSLSMAWPDQSADRVTLTVGNTTQFSDRGQISFDIGGTFSDGGSTRIVGRLDYQNQLTPNSNARANLQRQVSDASDGAVILRTRGQIGYDVSLTSLTTLAFDLRYLERENLSNGSDLEEYGVSFSVNRQLTSDWLLTVGLGQTTRKETGLATAKSETVYFSIGRAWTGRF